MTTRDRTKAFMTYRESRMRHKPKKVAHSGNDDNDEAALLGNDHVEQHGAAVERPSWMAFIDEANVDIDTIKTKRTAPLSFFSPLTLF